MIKEHDWADDHEFNVWRCAMGIKQVKQINAAWGAYQAGKRAAPTPPAQNPWQEAVLNECMAIEGCYVEADPVKTVKCLIDWHVMNERKYSSAQEDEPVAWRRTQRDCCDEYYIAYYDDEDGPPVDNGGPWEPLYTRPQSDELRINNLEEQNGNLLACRENFLSFQESARALLDVLESRGVDVAEAKTLRELLSQSIYQ